jgi:hypothetical protein
MRKTGWSSANNMRNALIKNLLGKLGTFFFVQSS